MSVALYNRKQLEIVKLACKDDTRQVMTGLYVDGNTTVITDGHKLIAVKSETETKVEDWPANSIPWKKNDTDPFIISREQVEKALKNIPKKPSMPILEHVAIGKVENDHGKKELSCQTTDLESTDNVEGREIDGTYPDFKKVMPPYLDDKLYQAIGVSAKYLKEICTLLEKYQPRGNKITLHVRKSQAHKVISFPMKISTEEGEVDDIPVTPLPKDDEPDPAHFPIVLTAEDGEGTEVAAVIMPMRL